MAESRRGLADRVQSVAGFTFLLGLLVIAVPLVFPPESGTVLAAEIAAGLALLALAAWSAWQGRREHPQGALVPSVAAAAIGLALAALAVLTEPSAAHRATILVMGLAVVASAGTDAWMASRASRTHRVPARRA